MPTQHEFELESLHVAMVKVEAQLEKLTDAVATLAVVEERQTQTTIALDRAFKAIAKLDDKLNEGERRVVELEKAQQPMHSAAKWVDRGLVAMLGAGAALFGKQVTGG